MYIDAPTITRLATQLREELGEDIDSDTLLDTLDGETDVLDITDRILASMQDDAALHDAAKAQADALAARAKRFKDRAATKKRLLHVILDATGERKIERPAATISRLKGRVSVQITDAASVPTQLCKTTVAPDLTAIKKQLEAGESVPGAELSQGAETISVRVK